MLSYFLISSASLILFYIVYLLVYRTKRNFKHERYFLIFSVIISLLLPLLKAEIEFQAFSNSPKAGTVFAQNTAERIGVNSQMKKATVLRQVQEIGLKVRETKDVNYVLKSVYLAIAGVFLVRIGLQLFLMLSCAFFSKKIIDGQFVIVVNSKYKSTFSFFNLIFINKENYNLDETNKIISHEKIHALQYHSLDAILIELVSAAMWFNPVVWLVRRSLQQVHEYLADEGALSTGIDKLEYQALLVNQVAEGRLVGLSSSFNHSLIKKRMIMMNKSKIKSNANLRGLALIPVAALLLFAVACVNGQNSEDIVAAIEPTRMNILYLGVDNPVRIAASGIEASEITAVVDNGTITGENGNYSIRPEKPGNATVLVKRNGKEIQRAEFRVKIIPSPQVAIKLASGNYATEGYISKADLQNAEGIEIVMMNFDFDMEFEVVSFVLSASVPNSNVIREEISNSDKFSKLQKDLINSLSEHQKLMIEFVKVKGEDGKIREIPPTVLNIRG